MEIFTNEEEYWYYTTRLRCIERREWILDIEYRNGTDLVLSQDERMIRRATLEQIWDGLPLQYFYLQHQLGPQPQSRKLHIICEDYLGES